MPFSAHKQAHTTWSLTLRAIFTEYRGRIILTYLLTLLENLFELLYPSVTGLAVNGLLRHRFSGVAVLLSIWLVHTVTGVFRQGYDARIFTSIYTDFATQTVLSQGKEGTPTSQIVARSALSREFVNFFEHDIPATVASAFSLLGALVMLLFYDHWSAALCVVVFVPMAILNRSYSRRTLALNRRLNNQLEREVDVLTRRPFLGVRRHYQLLSGWRIRLANAEAANWGIMELFNIGAAAAVIVRVGSMPHLQPGTVYAMLAYLWNFLSSLGHVPSLIQQLSRLQDIARRMEGGASNDA
ncbi:MAG TPA: ABC transporter six-transmembrane domain-containing protein [Chthoniobacterales bacterium]